MRGLDIPINNMEEPAKILKNFIWFSFDFNIQPGLRSKMVFGHFKMMFPNREYKAFTGIVLVGCQSDVLHFSLSPSPGKALELICWTLPLSLCVSLVIFLIKLQFNPSNMGTL